jgi:hypothetical protein
VTTVFWTARAQDDLATIREVILSPYRIVYRVIDVETLHILTVDHAARAMPVDVPNDN